MNATEWVNNEKALRRAGLVNCGNFTYSDKALSPLHSDLGSQQMWPL